MTNTVIVATNTTIRRGRPADNVTRLLALEAAKTAAGKSTTWMHYEVTRLAAKRGIRVGSAATISKYVKMAVTELNAKVVDARAIELKQINTIINLQTYNLVRAGVKTLREAATRLRQVMLKKGIIRSVRAIVKLLKANKPGAFVSRIKKTA